MKIKPNCIKKIIVVEIRGGDESWDIENGKAIWGMNFSESKQYSQQVFARFATCILTFLLTYLLMLEAFLRLLLLPNQ